MNSIARFVSRLLVASGLLVALAAGAQQFPAKPIRIVVPYPPGGQMDQHARFYANHLSVSLGSPVYVENKAGAEGVIGSHEVARSAADGHTLLAANFGTHALNPHLFQLPYDTVEDFTPVAMMTRSPQVLLVSASSKFDTLEKLLEHAKQNPGKLNYGSIATHSRLYAELLRRATGIDMVYIPHKGSADALRSLYGGDIDLIWDSATSAIAQVKGGRARALAVTGSERLEVLPNVPTASERGVKGLEFNSWFGFFGPKGISAPVLNRLNEELVKIVKSSQARALLVPAGNTIAGLAPAEFAVALKKDRDNSRQAVNQAGIKPGN